jgi:hypothetical protein
MSDLKSPPPGNALLAAHERARRASLTKANLEKLVRGQQLRIGELEELLAAAAGALEPRELAAIGDPQQPGVLPIATYIALASDWHLGERVRSVEVNGLNEYNPDIACQRAERFWQANLTMLNISRAAWDIRQIVVWLGGDFMTNWIHEELVSENFLSPTEETKLVYDVLSSGLEFILARYDCERVVVLTSSGNHGRNTHKKHAAGSFRTSYEFLVYQLLEERFKGRVEFQLGYGYENHYTVHGMDFSFHHGDKVRSQGGVGGIYPALYRRIHRTGAGAGGTPRHHCYGHHHTESFAPLATGNGSLIGPSPFSVGEGFTSEPPQQASLVVDAKRKAIGAMWPIFVKEPRRGRR